MTRRKPPFNYTERGLRFYVNIDGLLAVVAVVTRRGTFHLVNDSGRKVARGAGVGQLVRALRILAKQEHEQNVARMVQRARDAQEGR